MALGAESQTERAVKRIAPWVASLLVHMFVVILGFFVTWTVVMIQREEEPTRIVADFYAMRYEPVSQMEAPQTQTPPLTAEDRLPDESPAEVVDRLEVDIDPMSLIHQASGESALWRFAPQRTRITAEFVGLSSTNARRITYVIDASGSMIRALPIVIDELARSLDGLVPPQRFSVIFFQRNEALIVPPPGRLIPATEDEKLRVLAWIDENVIPAGRSNPLEAIAAAMRLKPDVIFLLSENITGSGEFEIDQADLLAMLEQLNPVDPQTGRRPTQINCVQFLDPDPLGTLQKIAEAHGGEKGYKFLDRAELGLKSP